MLTGKMAGNNAGGGNYNISCEINLSANIGKRRNCIEEKVEDMKSFTSEIC